MSLKLGSRRLVVLLRRILSYTARLQIFKYLLLFYILCLVHLEAWALGSKRLDARLHLVLFHTLSLQILSNTFATMLCSHMGLPTHRDPSPQSRDEGP